MTRLSSGRRRALGNHILALSDQGATALVSLVVVVWLIRRGTPDELAAYVFWANAALVMTTITAAFTSVHLFRLPPAPSPGRRGSERAILSAAIAVTALSAALCGVAAPLLPAPFDRPTAAVFVPACVFVNYARALAVSRGELLQPALISAVQLGAVGAVLAIEAAGGQASSAGTMLAVLGVVQGLMAAAVAIRLSPREMPDFSRASRRRWRVLARRSRWSLLAGLGNEVLTRLYIVAVSVRFGPAALAAVTAAQTMLRPATLLAGAFGASVRNALAQRRQAGDAEGIWRLLMLGAAVPAAATLALGAAVATSWPLVSALVYGGRYAGLQVSVCLWAVVMAISCFWVSGLVGLQALGLLRQHAKAELTGAAVCALAMGPLVWFFSPPAALVATAVGGISQVTVLLRALRVGLQATVGPLSSGPLIRRIGRRSATV